MNGELKYNIAIELVNNPLHKNDVMEILLNYLDCPDILSYYIGEIESKKP